MNSELKDKVALVTGASSGIGKACTTAFAKAGESVALLSEKKADIEAVAREIGGDALPLTADVADAGQMAAAVDQLIRRFGRLDVVHANAGINGVWAPIDDLTVAEWDRTISINLRGTFLTIHHAVPHLKKAGGGAIVVTSSINGTRYFANAGATAYAVSKAGQLAMVQQLAVELGPSNIRINAICPGSISTNIDQSTTQRNVEQINLKGQFERNIPLSNRPGSSEQVASSRCSSCRTLQDTSRGRRSGSTGRSRCWGNGLG